MDTTDIKDTTETMAIPALEYPGTILGGCPGPLETQAYLNNATQQHSGCPENLNGYPTGLCLGHKAGCPGKNLCLMPCPRTFLNVLF